MKVCAPPAGAVAATFPLTGTLPEYGLPIDEEELDRIDMSHAKYGMLLGKRLFLAPITSQPQKILDIGTGTGIWAINVFMEVSSVHTDMLANKALGGRYVSLCAGKFKPISCSEIPLI